MRGPHNIFRLMRMGATLARTGALKALFDVFNIPASIRAPVRFLCWTIVWMGAKGDSRLEPVPRALVALGPVYIKFGQILSTRPDVVGAALAEQLRFLQDDLPPFSLEQAKKLIEQELGQPWESCFREIGPPIAAASIAQVHKARLKANNQRVAVKLLRPGIEKAFRKDIDAFYFAATTFERISAEARRLRFKDVIRHFESIVQTELDLRTEAAAASEFLSLNRASEKVYIPWVDFSLSTRAMLVMEWIEGIPISALDRIEEAKISPQESGIRILQLFLTHALRDGYFHADMHQGNIMISASGKIILYDFGIMGRIDDYTRRVYAEILHGFIRRDYMHVAEIHFEAGYVPADKDVHAFAQALRAVGEPVFGMEAGYISMARLLSHLFEVTERFGMQTRTELILLQRTMVVVEGVSRSLYPKLNIWEVAKPIVETYVYESIGPKAVLGDLVKASRRLLRFGPHLHDALAQALIAGRSIKAPKASPAPSAGKWKWLAIGLGAGILAMALLRGL